MFILLLALKVHIAYNLMSAVLVHVQYAQYQRDRGFEFGAPEVEILMKSLGHTLHRFLTLNRLVRWVSFCGLYENNSLLFFFVLSTSGRLINTATTTSRLSCDSLVKHHRMHNIPIPVAPVSLFDQ